MRREGVLGLLAVFAMTAAGCHPGAAHQAELDKSLLEASKAGNVAAIDQALAAGAHIDARSRSAESGRTPLMLAALRGKTEAVKSLLAKGAKVDERDASGMTALMWASFGGSQGAVDTLLAKGADLNAKDKEGHTALAWGKDRPKIAALLKQAGAKE